MKSTLQIARTELKVLFYSPIAWIVLIVFAIQTGLDYSDIMSDLNKNAVAGIKFPEVTRYIFADNYSGLYTVVQAKLYLYIPLLTMGLMGREISSGSIKLLFSSPLTIAEIVAGKMVAILSYIMLLIIILLVFVMMTLFYLPHADVGLMFSGLLGIFLMAAVYCSIGLFMSSLSSYQPVAALYTFVILAALNFIGSIGQNLDILRRASSFLAINGRTEQMVNGLITSRQLSYFVIMCALFIGLTVLKMNFERRPRPLHIRVLKYSGVVLTAIFLNYVAAMPVLTAYFDTTQIKSQTIIPASQRILENMPQIKVHTYVNLLGEDAAYGLPAARNQDIDFFDRYQRFLKKDILIDYIYYYDSLEPGANLYKQNPGISMKDLAENIADSRGFDMAQTLDSSAIRKLINLRPWKNRFMREFEIGDRKAMIGMYRDNLAVPREQEMMDAFKLMDVPQKHVAFLTGHNERVALEDGKKDRDYNTRMNTSMERLSVVNHGFDFRQIVIDSLDIPKDISLLIIADPQLPLKAVELARIQQYIDHGGDLWVLAEPNRKGLVNPIINPLGVHFADGTLLMESNNPDFTPDFLITYFAPEAAKYSRVLQGLISDSAVLTTHSAAPLTYITNGPFRIEPLIITNKNNTWNHPGTYDSAAIKILYDPAKGDVKGTYPIALTLERTVLGKDQRIMVFGDADMFSDGEFSGVPKKLWELTFESFKWFAHGEFPVDIYHPSGPDKLVTITASGVMVLRVLFLFIVPGILLIAGSLLLLIRRMR